MLNRWFGKEETTDAANGSDTNGSGVTRSTERNEQVKKLLDTPPSGTADWQSRKPTAPPTPLPFEQIYQTASVKPPKLTYGIQKVAEMGNSPHLAGMSTPFKRKALLMALEAAGTDVGQVLNDVVTRQRALKEYEESYQEKVGQFEAEQLEQNRLQKAELDRITAQYKARMDASLAEIERWQKDFREWQRVKQQELQRLTDAAALCVPRESEEEEEEISDGKVMAFTQRAGGGSR
jgi:hypothetical protein